ncbi:MAG: Bbp16 family capsid cement protein [Sulfuricella sp.]
MSIHTRRDYLLTVAKALPAAAANNDSASIDLGNTTPGVVADAIEVEIALPALPDLVEAKTVTCTLQDSANDSSFTAITGLSTFVVTGGTGNGAPAATRVVRLPSSVRRYIRVNTAVLTAGGDNTAKSVTLSLLV